MTVKDMVLKALKASQFDGLYNDECGCSQQDFMPCGECCCDCRPGYQVWKDGNWITQADPPLTEAQASPPKHEGCDE